VSAKYKLIGCMLSAGENVMNHDGAPKYEIKDHIFISHILFLSDDPDT